MSKQREGKEKFLRFPSFMSEQRLSTRSKTSTHHKKSSFFLVSAGQKHIHPPAGPPMCRYNIGCLYSYSKTTTAVNGAEHQKTVNNEKIFESEKIGCQKASKHFFIQTRKEKGQEEAQPQEKKLYP